jgi:DNA-binding NtrC family response regulator
MAKVLVVDDKETYRRYLTLELEVQGHEVVVAASAREAIEVGVELPPDVLVVDWMLNDERNGLEVADAIWAANSDVQTILITGYPSADLRRDTMERGIRFIKKPFTLKAIAEAVHKAARQVKRQ